MPITMRQQDREEKRDPRRAEIFAKFLGVLEGTKFHPLISNAIVEFVLVKETEGELEGYIRGTIRLDDRLFNPERPELQIGLFSHPKDVKFKVVGKKKLDENGKEILEHWLIMDLKERSYKGRNNKMHKVMAGHVSMRAEGDWQGLEKPDEVAVSLMLKVAPVLVAVTTKPILSKPKKVAAKTAAEGAETKTTAEAKAS